MPEEKPVSPRLLFAGILVASVLIFGSSALHAFMAQRACHVEGCTTDTECLALCPADDEECDGGPEGDQEREQRRLCRLDAAHCE
jgi:hypothetical protein